MSERCGCRVGWSRRSRGPARSLAQETRVSALDANDGRVFKSQLTKVVALKREEAGGKLEVEELPGAWSDAAAYWFGARPRTDLDGWLQDGYWSSGLFGYSPTYTMGNLAAAQLAEALKRDRPDLEHEFARGEFAPTLGWLREKVHRHRSTGNVFERVQVATGHALAPEAFLRHLDAQYGPGQR